MLVLELLGTLSLRGDTGPVPLAAQQKRRLGLLSILALGGRQGLSRDRIEAYLWPESSAAQARHALDQTVYAIRHALGSDFILSTGRELRLNPKFVEADLWDFEDAIRAGRWAAAVGHYKGPLLDGFHFSDSRELESWIDAERARLRLEYHTVVESLANASAEAGDHSQSVTWWRRLANSDPLSAGATKKLMLALAAAGDRAGAVKHARLYQELVRQELDIEPDSEIENLARTFSHPVITESIDTAAWPRPTSLSQPTTPHIGAPKPRISEKSERRGLVTAVGLALVLLTLVSSSWYWYDHKTPVVALAVLPFENLGKSDDAYFAVGMAEEISSRLGTLPGLQLIGRQSTKSYANTNKPVAQIGKELGVAYLLTGSVRWDRSRTGHNLMKVSTSLIRASDGAQVWSEPYQDEVTGVFEIQGRVAESVAQALKLRLTEGQQRTLTSRPTNNLEAYDYYLRAKALGAGTLDPAEIYRAVGLYEHAVALDPQFAKAYASLASADLQVYWFRGDQSPRRLDSAKAAINRALALEPKLPAAYAALAEYYYRTKLDYPRALDAIAIAQRLAPSDPDALYVKALVERRQNHWKEAISDLNRASEIDPRNTLLLAGLCEMQMLNREYDDAERSCGRMHQIEPEKWLGYYFLARIAVLRSGDVKTALGVLEDAQKQVGAKQVGAGLTAQESRSIWPAVRNPEFARYMQMVAEPAEEEQRLGYFVSKVELAVYQRNAAARRQFADSIILYVPRSLRGNFFDGEKHAELSLAYAAKGDKDKSLEEGKRAMGIMPFKRDAQRWAENLELIVEADVLVGANDEAVMGLRQLLSESSESSPASLRVDPWFQPLRKDPRFEQFVSLQ
jgi:DNA-binding SARP family transcriptional activator/TolB-like protein/Tfp pilus assembly protein PilF